MPGYAHRYRNRSAEHAAADERLKQKQRDSWAHLQEQVAAKYQTEGIYR